MNIVKIFSFLTRPGKGLATQPSIGATTVPLNGKLYNMLAQLFDKADRECKIEISFLPSSTGQQNNNCRNDLIKFINAGNKSAARSLAKRLQSVTTNRSSLGLVFMILGKQDKKRKLVISRFPADNGILAEEDQTSLKVEFLEKVFMRNAIAYKAALYEGSSMDADFWTGRVVDKQINSNVAEASGYWVREFLASDFCTTPAAGTRRLAVALREAMQSAVSLSIKEEILAAARLAGSQSGRTITINDFAERFGLSDETKEAVERKLKHPSLSFDHFTFDHNEFKSCLPYQSVELNNGAVLTAAVTSFDECFRRKEVKNSPGEFIFKTQGKIVDEKLRKSK